MAYYRWMLFVGGHNTYKRPRRRFSTFQLVSFLTASNGGPMKVTTIHTQRYTPRTVSRERERYFFWKPVISFGNAPLEIRSQLLPRCSPPNSILYQKLFFFCQKNKIFKFKNETWKDAHVPLANCISRCGVKESIAHLSLYIFCKKEKVHKYKDKYIKLCE